MKDALLFESDHARVHDDVLLFESDRAGVHDEAARHTQRRAPGSEGADERDEGGHGKGVCLRGLETFWHLCLTGGCEAGVVGGLVCGSACACTCKCLHV